LKQSSNLKPICYQSRSSCRALAQATEASRSS